MVKVIESSNKGNTWKVFPNPYKEGTILLVNLVPGFDFGVPLSLKLAQILGKHESFSSVNIDRISDWLTSMLGKSMRGIYIYWKMPGMGMLSSLESSINRFHF